MTFLWTIAGLSAALLGVALSIGGLRDLVLVAGPMLIAAIYLIFRGHFLAPDAPEMEEVAPPARKPGGTKAPAPVMVVLDGSNVMHWQEGAPSLEPVKSVIAALTGRGVVPGVIFDASAGYRIGPRYLDDRDFARLLSLPEDRVLTVPKGTPADAYILAAARRLKARVVTNDRYRDWAGQFPEVAEPGFLIRGGMRGGSVWLEP